MKKYILLFLLIFALLVGGCGDATADTTLPVEDTTLQTGDGTHSPEVSTDNPPSDTQTEPPTELCAEHSDENNDGNCDDCGSYVIVLIDLYAINDLHGKFADTDAQPGVDELTTYLKNARKTDDNVIFLASGDMWQGSSESNLTKGLLITDWMNELDFVAMTLGNHEYDWGEEYIEANLAAAEFPFLAINVYDRATNKPVDYCKPSVTVEIGGATVGIIGAIGDCYSSISGDKVEDVYFKTGAELTALVKAEAERLRAAGADLIVYSLHDGHGNSLSSVTTLGNSQIRSYYDASLSGGYVDVVFEGHSHQRYVFTDGYGVYHLQNGGDNKGISHVELAVNVANEKTKVNTAEFVPSSKYDSLSDDPVVEELLDKYDKQISMANRVLGMNDRDRNGTWLRQLVADLYLEAGLARWGNQYDIVLGGGYISVRSPGYLAGGEVKYSDLQMLFPFDNQLMLCSVSGSKLISKFISTNNSNYFIAYSDHGKQVKNSIDPSRTYYVIVDAYSASYAPNGLTVVESYDADVFARDLLAAYVEKGGLGGVVGSYELTSLPDVLAIGGALADNAETAEIYFVRGEIVSIDNTRYGNMTIRDENGNTLYVYGLYDGVSGVRFDAMAPQPQVGDTVILSAPIKKYVNASGVKVELINARLLSCE